MDLKLLQQKLKSIIYSNRSRRSVEKWSFRPTPAWTVLRYYLTPVVVALPIHTCKKLRPSCYQKKTISFVNKFFIFQKHSNRVSTSAQTAGNGLPEISSPMQLEADSVETSSVGPKPPFALTLAQSKPPTIGDNDVSCSPTVNTSSTSPPKADSRSDSSAQSPTQSKSIVNYQSQSRVLLFTLRQRSLLLQSCHYERILGTRTGWGLLRTPSSFFF